jgi:hypothetical protein
LHDHKKLYLFYQLVTQNPSIKTITFIYDSSPFRDTKNPHQYARKSPVQTFYKPQPPHGKSGFTSLNEIVGNLFTDIRHGTTHHREKFKKFLADHKDWKQPTISYASIARRP